jgi:CubicO group peptidase (beta-lactamase class C family)
MSEEAESVSETMGPKASERPATARQLGIMQGFPPPPESRPTLENWDQPPFNRWSFQHVRSLIPTVEVYRGKGPPRPLDRGLQDLGPVRFIGHDGVEKNVTQFLSETYTDGFLVSQHGCVVTEMYFNDMDVSTPHLSQSVAKSIVGTLAGILVGRGILDPQAPLVEYVPELAVCGYADAHVFHVLNMRSGVHFGEDYGVPGSDIARIDIASGWRPQPDAHAPLTIRDVILTLHKAREHGEFFEYRSIETDVLAWAMERAAGASLAELVSRELWSRLGVEHDAYFTVDTAGTALADGGFNATLRDYARFGQLMVHDGRVGDEQVVPPQWVAACRTGDTAAFGSPYSDISPGGAYSNQWWVNDIMHGDFMARGVFGQLIYIDPEHELVVVKLSTWPDYLNPAFLIDTLRAISAIRAYLA